MLQFNPYLRPSAKELLDHPFFNEVRQEENEVQSKVHLRLDIDLPLFFNYPTLS